MIDIDCFKAFNDGYSHPDGNAALRIVADGLRKTCGKGGSIGRLGGGEFGLILTSIAGEILAAVGDELCRAVEACTFAHRWSAVAPIVTISVGLAGGRVRQGQRNCPRLFCLADKTLYEPKRSCRNRAMLVNEITTTEA